MIIWYVAAALLCGKATSLHERNARPLNKCYRRFRRHCWHYTQSKSRPLFIYLFIFLHKSTVPFNCSMCVSFAIYSSPVLKVIQENEVCPPIAFYFVFIISYSIRDWIRNDCSWKYSKIVPFSFHYGSRSRAMVPFGQSIRVALALNSSSYKYNSIAFCY